MWSSDRGRPRRPDCELAASTPALSRFANGYVRTVTDSSCAIAPLAIDAGGAMRLASLPLDR
jgi:hypothetical protein